MFRKCLFFSVCVCLKVVGSDLSFDSIIRENADNPSQVLELLRGMRERSSEADAFLREFGGENYEEEQGSVKGLSPDVEYRVKEASFIIGNALRRKGAERADDIESLETSRRFLEFAGSEVRRDFQFHDGDVSSSFMRDQLEDMIARRKELKEKADMLEKKWTDNSADDDSEDLSETLLKKM